jgi:hypothetical protein
MESNATDKPVPREIVALLSNERLVIQFIGPEKEIVSTLIIRGSAQERRPATRTPIPLNQAPEQLPIMANNAPYEPTFS